MNMFSMSFQPTTPTATPESRWSMFDQTHTRESDPFERSLDDHLQRRSERNRDHTANDDTKRIERERPTREKRESRDVTATTPDDVNTAADETSASYEQTSEEPVNESQTPTNEASSNERVHGNPSESDQTQLASPDETTAEHQQSQAQAVSDVLLREQLHVQQSTQTKPVVETSAQPSLQSQTAQTNLVQAQQTGIVDTTQAPPPPTAAELVARPSIIKDATKPLRQATSTIMTEQNATGNPLVEQPAASSTSSPAGNVVRADITVSVMMPTTLTPELETTTSGSQPSTALNLTVGETAANTTQSNHTTQSQTTSSTQGRLDTLSSNLESTAGQDRLNTSRLNRALQHAVRQADSSVTLRLTPPEMGTVRIQLSVEAGRVAAVFHADTAEARDLLGRQVQQLRQSLDRQGLTLERVSIQPMQNHHSNTSQSSTEQAPDDGRSRGGQDQQARRQDQHASQQGRDFQGFSEMTETDQEQLATTTGGR